jgi:CRP-like cAMP-binding protein
VSTVTFPPLISSFRLPDLLKAIVLQRARALSIGEERDHQRQIALSLRRLLRLAADAPEGSSVSCTELLRRRFSDATSIPAKAQTDRADNQMHVLNPSPRSNLLLAKLPRADFDLLEPTLTTVRFAQGEVLCEAGAQINQVFFPLSGMISLVVVMKDGKVIETATVGREGVVGAMAGLGLHKMRVRAIAQLPVIACVSGASQMRKVTAVSKRVTDLCYKYNEVLLEQARITAACNALHKVDARFCRRLLQTRDRAESDSILLTQEMLSAMLGVRRTSVTEVASKIREAGAIKYSRGVIKILDLEAVKAVSCECYERLKEND